MGLVRSHGVAGAARKWCAGLDELGQGGSEGAEWADVERADAEWADAEWADTIKAEMRRWRTSYGETSSQQRSLGQCKRFTEKALFLEPPLTE